MLTTKQAIHWFGVVGIALTLAACGDDGDGEKDGAAGDGGDGDGDGPSLGSIDGDTLASALSAEEIMGLCGDMDERVGLLNDVAGSCQAEAWTLSVTPAECDEILRLCNDNGRTVLGFEVPSGCADTGLALPDCDAKVADMLACADDLGEFLRGRTCLEEGLFDAPPTCLDELSEPCPALYGSPSQ